MKKTALEKTIEKFKTFIPENRLLREEPLALHTSFRIGGPADAFVIVHTEKELAALLRILQEDEIEHMLIGNGSNLLFRDEGYHGVIIKLEGDYQKIYAKETCLFVGGAKLLSGAASYAKEQELSGFEFAAGIPGSIGGAVFMNAGAYGGEMKDIVKCVRLMKKDGSAVYECMGKNMDFSYRHSCLNEKGDIVQSVVLQLEKGIKEEITARMRELNEKRTAKQPVNYPSAGSTFKRPAGGFAAALIEEAGLKGLSVGGAEVSQKHSGFIINKGGATCNDVLALIEKVKEKVYQMSGILLEPEVRIIGDGTENK